MSKHAVIAKIKNLALKNAFLLNCIAKFHNGTIIGKKISLKIKRFDHTFGIQIASLVGLNSRSTINMDSSLVGESLPPSQLE